MTDSEGYTAFVCRRINKNALTVIVAIQYLSDSDIMNGRRSKTSELASHYDAVKITPLQY